MSSTTPFSELAKLGPPAADEIEVCLFGPSFGESALIHIGDGRWLVVDSCAYAGVDGPIALHYLDQHGIDASAIETVLITHWHDDHCRGASKLVASTPRAKVWIAQTLTNTELLRFAFRMNTNKTAIAGSKLTEFIQIMKEIAERKKRGETTFGFAIQNHPLHYVNGSQLAHGASVKFTALSPSHGDHLDFLERIGDLFPRTKLPKRALGGPSPNEISVASILEIGPESILLGADLENTKAGSGWDAVLKANRSNRFGSPAKIYKIPHHGSLTAHNTSVWSDMLASDPFAILTPWRKGRGRLPNDEGIKKITKLSKQSFSTSRHPDGRPKTRSPAVQSYLRSNNIQLRNLKAPAGFVRMRKKPGADWNVELFEPACHLASMLRRRTRSPA
jgi:beta-lactamase superfamily II metal-dependent hydrolase